MDKMRKDFERWFRIQGHIMERHPEYVECYFNPIVQSHWAAWQASRAALRVELPSAWRLAEHEYKRQVEESLDSAGVSYE